jgi:ankyrin repeat protein
MKEVVMSRPIPARPNLERDRKAAKALVRLHAAGDSEALARIRAHHPRFRGQGDGALAAAPFRLADALLVVAREYGVESWPRWKALAEFLCADFDARVGLFLTAALGDDARQSEALLARVPGLAAADLHAACAACDAGRVAEQLARDPAAATQRGGPCDAEPLWTLCFSNVRLDDGEALAARVHIAQSLLAHGADPSATAVKDSDFGPFTASALYGTIARNLPELTQLLLEAGAVPDGDTLYHAAECRSTDCLRALLAHGARTPGSFALHHAIDYPGTEAIRLLLDAGADPNEVHPRGCNALQHAARRGRGSEEIDLLLRHGAAIDAADGDGRTAYAIARRLGHLETAAALRSRGASDSLPERDRFAIACAAGDLRTARDLVARDPDLLARAVAEDAALLPEAARLDHRDAVRLMLDLGFPIEAAGGFDLEATALNHAALHAHPEMVGLLLARGANPEARNPHGGTALGALSWGSRYAIPPVDTRPRDEAERQRDVVAAAERLIAAGARILPQHLANASPLLAELLRSRGSIEEDER